MLAPESRLSLLLRDRRCLRCQFQAVRRSKISLRYSSNTPQPSADSSENEIAPLVLNRPIGLLHPPVPGQNTGLDKRSLKERHNDFVNKDKHSQRTKDLKNQLAKPYFREWTNLRYNDGKTFIANPRLFKRDLSFYFPNLYGTTLASPSKPQDTTTVIHGKVSVVSLFSSLWAEQQVATFTDLKQNPGLLEALKVDPSIAQQVSINLEESAMKAWLVRMFMWRLRRQLPVEQHDRYFLVRKGLTEPIKQSIGMLNSKVGYVYLLDDVGHIRWAGSGPAAPEEKESLNAGLLKLIHEKKSHGSSRSRPESTSATETTSGKAKPRVIPHQTVRTV
ncbi:putative F1F0 ATP synthase assembly protein Atp10 [Talaromyces proteolyticus]|uniref:F1F0 ATP synthase assembly protein Atp10 n=1 Tax=Talaromyces proteolyticus TaxID=1131652 RepID=A0AAD4Q0I5_9EURO|nr:putative F1F0 ATP synthase assembly protein Atp10 [Talaromyces proteolyticus]KAH8697291.1 putative F1F0 ATP synthase assembly protein Atp10 [Talaromyces proteolyticus]